MLPNESRHMRLLTVWYCGLSKSRGLSKLHVHRSCWRFGGICREAKLSAPSIAEGFYSVFALLPKYYGVFGVFRTPLVYPEYHPVSDATFHLPIVSKGGRAKHPFLALLEFDKLDRNSTHLHLCVPETNFQEPSPA
jgi:hypothetical protein